LHRHLTGLGRFWHEEGFQEKLINKPSNLLQGQGNLALAFFCGEHYGYKCPTSGFPFSQALADQVFIEKYSFPNRHFASKPLPQKEDFETENESVVFWDPSCHVLTVVQRHIDSEPASNQ